MYTALYFILTCRHSALYYLQCCSHVAFLLRSKSYSLQPAAPWKQRTNSSNEPTPYKPKGKPQSYYGSSDFSFFFLVKTFYFIHVFSLVSCAEVVYVPMINAKTSLSRCFLHNLYLRNGEYWAWQLGNILEHLRQTTRPNQIKEFRYYNLEFRVKTIVYRN